MDVDTVTVELSSNASKPAGSKGPDQSSSSPIHPSPLFAQATVSTVPGTPNADTPQSFPIPNEPSISTLHQNHAQNGKVTAIRGTPFAGVHHEIRRPVPPSTVARVGFATPFRNSYLALTPSIPSADYNASHTRKRPADDLDCFGDNSEGRDEFEQQEALLYLEIARARGDVRKLEQKLAQARCDESKLTGRLYKLQAEEAEKRFDAAEAQIGTIRNSIRMTGGVLCNTAQKRHRVAASEDSIRINGLPSGLPEV